VTCSRCANIECERSTQGLEAVLFDGLEDQMMSQRLPLPLEQVVYAQEMTQSLILLLV
jgi:hypothetical protein